MKRTMTRISALILSVVLVFCTIPFVSTSAAETATVTYTFIGDNASRAGYAQGIITVTPSANSAKSGYYLVYYTDGTNVLSEYDELASFAITGSAASFEIPDGIMIPTAAKGIAVFESTTDFVDNAPAISTAVATAEIPASKRLSLGSPEVTFGTASDVHMNYEDHNRNAHSKWLTALNFFADNNASYVIVTGDMTGDETDSTSLSVQYQDYVRLINESNIDISDVYEAVGNHGNKDTTIGMFTQYTKGTDEVRPSGDSDSPYFYVLKEGATASARDNLFIFMRQENLSQPGYSAQVDNFSAAQIDWVASVLEQFDDGNTNIFIIEHSPFLNYGAGDVYKGGGYLALTTFSSNFKQNMRLKGLLQEHKNAVVMSGHTHLTLYDWANYSDVNNEFARTVHVGSTCWPRAYIANGSCPSGTDGRKTAGLDYGSEAYLVDVYADYIVYTGYNLTTGKKIPAACLIMPTTPYSAPTPEESFKGSGTEEDPYLIEDEQDFLLLTSGFNNSNTTDITQMYGYGKYFRQTADIDLSNIKTYWGTVANGGSNPYTGTASAYRTAFAGTYNGDGYTIKVDLDGFEQRSVFPYLYGTLVNVVIKGSITSNDTAQPVRTSRGNIINCFFDLDLTATNVHGVVYSNYSYMYNVYSRGTLNGTTVHPIASHDATDATVNNIYHYYLNSSGADVADNIGTRTNDVEAVRAAFNNTSTAAYSEAKAKIGSIELCDILGGVSGISDNIAYGKPFSPEGYYTTTGNWPSDYRTNLTDGVASDVLSTAADDDNWYAFTASVGDSGVSNVKDGVGTVIIDLQGNYTIESFETNLYVGEYKYGIVCPLSVKVSTSWDNKTYSEPVNVALPAPSGENVDWVGADINNAGRYVKVEYALAGSFVFLNEIKVYGESTTATACTHEYKTTVTDKTCTEQGYTNHYCPKCGDSYNTDVVAAGHTEGQWEVVKKAEVGVDGKKELRCTECGELLDEETIPAITEDHTHAALEKWYTNADSHWHHCSCGEKMDSASHTAGEWETGENGKEVQLCTVCGYKMDERDASPEDGSFVLGDVNASGAIDMMDYILLKRNYFGTFDFDSDQLKAGDCNRSGAIDMMDYILLKRAYFGTYELI